MTRAIWLLLAGLCLATLPARAAEEKIWVGLFLAENEPAAGKPTASPALTARLRQVFGFTSYQLIKGEDFALAHEWKHWVVPRNDFFIQIEPIRGTADAPGMLDYEIYKDGFIVAKGKYEPQASTPLFINGPDYRKGRFIFVIERR